MRRILLVSVLIIPHLAFAAPSLLQGTDGSPILPGAGCVISGVLR